MAAPVRDRLYTPQRTAIPADLAFLEALRKLAQ